MVGCCPAGAVAEGAVAADAVKLAQKTREYALQVILQLELEALKVGDLPISAC